MKNKRKRTFLAIYAGLFAILFTVVTATCIFAGSSKASVFIQVPDGFSSPDTVYLLPAEENQFILVGTKGMSSFAMLLSKDGQVLSQVTEPDYSTYPLYSNGQLSLIAPYRNENSGEFGIRIIRYTLDRNLLDKKHSDAVMRGVSAEHSNDLTVDSAGRYYVAHSREKDSLLIIDTSNGFDVIQSIPTALGSFAAIAVSPDQVLYTMYPGESKLGILPLPDSITPYTPLSDPPLFNSEMPMPEFRFLSSRLLIDAEGDVYQVLKESNLLVKTVETGGDSSCAALLGSGQVLVKTEDSRAAVFDEEEEVGFCTFDGELMALANHANGTVAVVIGEDGWCFTPVTEDMIEATDHESSGENSEDPGEESGEPSSEAPGSGEGEPGEIQSEVYRIDRNTQKIYVKEKTTYAVLKNHLKVNGAILRAEKPNGVTMASGYVMTGAVLLAESEHGITDSLMVIVPGDLNGTGYVTETSSKILYRVLNGTAELEEAAFAAADLDGDGVLTTVDLLMLKKELMKPS